MQEQAKVSLSPFELKLVSDSQWILTKNGIIQKVYHLFGNLSEVYKTDERLIPLPEAVTAIGPKISKGENYNGLPYVMLDYPRCFGKEDVFAIRSFFWWGKFFSITLQLKGIYKEQYQQKIIIAIRKGLLNHCSINTDNEEWNHNIIESMRPIETADADNIVSKKIIKIAAIHPIEAWGDSISFYKKQFELFMAITNG
jgi:hypothetical protein